ncbi:MAG: phytanoyl-CoA dioxygenase family protein [Pseudomonadota bacterium]
MASILSAAQLAAFQQDGLVIVRGLFDGEETALLRRAMEEDPQVRDHILDRLDADGAATRISLWNRAGDSVYGLAARCERVVDTMAALLGGPVYHFQSKLTAKEPHVGGAWEWHQDYGYWYHNGCLFPSLASCMVALDRTTRDNGCLQLVRGSHRLGADRPCADSRQQGPGRRRPGADAAHHRDARDRPCRARAGRCRDLPLQHAASIGAEPLARPALDFPVLLQSGQQRHDFARAWSLLRAARDRAGRRDQSRRLKFASGAEDFTSRPFVPKVRESTPA